MTQTNAGTETSQPNRIKQERYRQAHEQLTRALDHGFYIEASMICESIITDRIHSHLHWRVNVARTLSPEQIQKRAPKLRGKLTFSGHANLGYLIRVLELDFDHLENDRYLGLPARLDNWRERRNRVAHGVTYTSPSLKSYPEDFGAFLEAARDCAQNGKTLLSCLGDWDRAVRRRVPKESPPSLLTGIIASPKNC